MSTRVNVTLKPEEKERFQRQAQAEGLSLSAWLRKAGETALRGAPPARPPWAPAELMAFFKRCSAREAASGEQEPDWVERSFGLCASEFTVSDAFDAALPDVNLRDLEG
jgi:hypothetical protein